MVFRDPLWLAAGLCVPAAVVWAARRLRAPGLRFPSVEGLEGVARHQHTAWHRVPLGCRVIALLLIAIALARPRQGLEESRITTEGIDIVLAIDVSTSMLAEDFELRGRRANRLAAVKDVVREFVAHRPRDRIGVVAFAGRPYTACPLTLDHGWLLEQLDRLTIGMIEDGTAIGSGIATGLNRLRHSAAKSQVLVALTDGVNNAGTVTPEAAAHLAKTLGVTLYTIGAGTKGLAPYPATDPFGRTVYQPVQIPVDDEGLTRVAEATGGRYFRATDAASLKTVYDEIDRLETVRFEQPRYLDYRERYAWFVVPALVLLWLEVLLGQTVLRVLP